jgi:hypothetical protein
MMLPAALVFSMHLLFPVAVADEVPDLNVDQVCQGIAQQGGSSYHDTATGKETEDCIKSENEVRQELVKRWSTFSESDKAHCINEAKMGGDSSYTELLTCLEMAADVRNLGKEPAKPVVPVKRKPTP